MERFGEEIMDSKEALLEMINSSRSQETCFETLNEACEELSVASLLEYICWLIDTKENK